MIRHFVILLSVVVISFISGSHLSACSPVQQAMGQTSVSRYLSAQVFYKNPALLSYIEKPSVSFSFRRPYNLNELDQLWISSSYSYNRLAVAIAFSNFGQADILTENHVRIGLSCNLIDPYMQIGAGLQYNQVAFGLNDYDNLSHVDFDFGLAGEYAEVIYHFAVYDINRSRYTDNDPETEIGYRAGIGIQSLNDFTVNLEISGRKNDPTRFHFGQEFVLQDYLLLRFGVVTEPTLPSAGFGIIYGKLRLDYAVNRHSRLDETHSLGLSYSF